MHGFQVSPKELEDLLFKQQQVADAAVVGVKDENGAEIPWAFLAPTKEAADVAEKERSEAVIQAINSQVAGYKKLKGVTWIEQLPKRWAYFARLVEGHRLISSPIHSSASGKVLKRELKKPEP